MATHERLWFGSLVAPLLRDLPEATAQAVKALGVDGVGACNVATFRQLLEVVGAHAAPGQPVFEQQRLLAHGVMQAFLDGVVGRALAQVVRLVHPRFSLSRMHRTFRLITNYLEVKVVEMGEGRAVLTFTPAEGLTGWLLGLCQSSGEKLRSATATSQVTVLSDDGVTATLLFEWTL
jgi:uncharacterized protein (TIGR02265 family)